MYVPAEARLQIDIVLSCRDIFGTKMVQGLLVILIQDISIQVFSLEV